MKKLIRLTNRRETMTKQDKDFLDFLLSPESFNLDNDPEANKWWYCNVCGGKAKAKNMLIVFGELTCPKCAKGIGEKGEPAYIG